MQTRTRQGARTRRHTRVRKKVVGTASRPRLAVFRSARHIYAQLIDDTTATTIAAASSMDPEIRGKKDMGNKTAVGTAVGKLLAERAKQSAIEAVVFDRGGYKYHGRVAALADGAREGGLRF